MPRLLDLFCGRWGWSRAFAARGWECWGLDLVEPPEIPQNCHFEQVDILTISPTPQSAMWIGDFMPGPPDFIVASSPCEEFSVHGMKHFHPNPKYPAVGIQLFSHTRSLCENFGAPYVMENVRPAQAFIGNASHHCGPFYLWGTGVPPLMPQGIKKGWGTKGYTKDGKLRDGGPGWKFWAGSPGRLNAIAEVAKVPPELANCVADYAEALLGQQCKSR